MKILKTRNILLVFIFTFILTVQELIAKTTPPAPRGNVGFGDSGVVGGSIDSLIPFVIIAGITFGIWGLQKQFEISKTK